MLVTIGYNLRKYHNRQVRRKKEEKQKTDQKLN